MNIAKLKNSRYLTKDEVGHGLLLTISHIAEENIGLQEAPEQGYVLHFTDSQKGMVLKPINGDTIAEIVGSEETDHWAGHQIILFNDTSVVYAGKRIGGIRVRPNIADQAPPPPQRPAQAAPSRPLPSGAARPGVANPPAPIARAGDGRPLHTVPYSAPGTPQVTRPASAKQVGRPDPFTPPDAVKDEYFDGQPEADQDGGGVSPGAI